MWTRVLPPESSGKASCRAKFQPVSLPRPRAERAQETPRVSPIGVASSREPRSACDPRSRLVAPVLRGRRCWGEAATPLEAGPRPWTRGPAVEGPRSAWPDRRGKETDAPFLSAQPCGRLAVSLNKCQAMGTRREAFLVSPFVFTVASVNETDNVMESGPNQQSPGTRKTASSTLKPNAEKIQKYKSRPLTARLCPGLT